MAHLTREQILSRKIGKGTATLPDGGTVAIRAMTKLEFQRAEATAEELGVDLDAVVLSIAMTDPALTPADVQEWMGTAPAGDVVAVITAVRDLSGMGEGAGKSGVATS